MEIIILTLGGQISERTRDRQACPLSPVLFNFYFDAAIKEKQDVLKSSYMVNGYVLNTLNILSTMLFGDDQLML